MNRQTRMRDLLSRANTLVIEIDRGARGRFDDLERLVAEIEELHAAPHNSRRNVDLEATKVSLLRGALERLRPSHSPRP